MPAPTSHSFSAADAPAVSRPGMSCPTAFLAEAAERWPNRTFFIDGVEVTYEKAWYQTLQIATWLRQNGVSRGDRVITAQRQSPTLHLITLAVVHIGGVISILSPQLRLEHSSHIVREDQPCCVFLEKTTRHLRHSVKNALTVWMDSGLNTGAWNEADFTEVLTTLPAWGLPFPSPIEDLGSLRSLSLSLPKSEDLLDLPEAA